MKLSEIYKIADEIAPKKLSDEYCLSCGAYDNSGILVDVDEEITGIVCALDLTDGAIDKAVASGANLILTHHPAIYGKIGDVRADTPLGKKLIRCIRGGISVLSMHLNLDCAEGGIDESLMQGILYSSGAGTRSNSFESFHKLSQGGYGKAYDIKEITLGTLVDGINKTFETERTLVYGERERKIKRAASFCGAGGDEDAIDFAAEQDADVFISSDIKHHLLLYAKEKGLAVIALTHAASETYGFKKYYEKIRQAVGLPCFWHADDLL